MTMLRKMTFAVSAVALSAFCVVAQETAPVSPKSNPNEAHILNCMVFAKHEVQVSAQEAGVLKELTEFAEEGKQVEKGTLLGQIDDGQSQSKLIVANAELAVAEAKAESDVNIRYNEAASGAAEQAWRLSKEANEIAPKSKSLVELERLKLEWRKAFLGIEQAKRERHIDQLTGRRQGRRSRPPLRTMSNAARSSPPSPAKSPRSNRASANGSIPVSPCCGSPI